MRPEEIFSAMVDLAVLGSNRHQRRKSAVFCLCSEFWRLLRSVFGRLPPGRRCAVSADIFPDLIDSPREVWGKFDACANFSKHYQLVWGCPS